VRAEFKDETEAEAHKKAQADKENEARAAQMLELNNLVNSKDTVIAELREQLRASARAALMLEEVAQSPEDLRLFPNNAGRNFTFFTASQYMPHALPMHFFYTQARALKC
jgi:hypothetical protein